MRPQRHRPGSPSRPSPLLSGPRKGLGTLAQPSMARWRCFCSLLITEEGTATPLPAVQLNLALKTPHIHWQHPVEAVVSSAESAAPSQSLRGIQRDHMPHNVHEGTVLEPCPHSTCHRVRLARACRLLTLRGADPSLCFEVNSSTGLQVRSTGLQLQDPNGGWDERGRHYRSKNPNSPRDKACQ